MTRPFDCQRMAELWDTCRDGELPAGLDAPCREHLRTCPTCAARWSRESDWLNELAQPDPPRDGGAFGRRVLAAWDPLATVSPSASAPLSPRLAVLTMRRIGAWSALAAAVALAISGVWWWKSLPRIPSTNGSGVDPLGQLIVELDARYLPQPARFFDGMQRVNARLDLRPWIERLALPVPDPAHMVAPSADEGNGPT